LEPTEGKPFKEQTVSRVKKAAIGEQANAVGRSELVLR